MHLSQPGHGPPVLPCTSPVAAEVNFNCWAGKLVPKSSPEYPAFWDASVEKLKAFQSRVRWDGVL